jgi:hypothetical protein
VTMTGVLDSIRGAMPDMLRASVIALS